MKSPDKTKYLNTRNISFLSPDLNSLENQKTGLLILFLFEDKKPLKGITSLVDWRLLGIISKHFINGFITGKRDETVLLNPGQRLPFLHIAIIGLGKRDDFNKDVFCSALNKMDEVIKGLKEKIIVTPLPGRAEELIESSDAITWFLDTMNMHDFNKKISIIELKKCQPIMMSSLEKWRLKHSITL
ncbi:MAG: hypothetical protein JXR91_07170 [Deltaproteobacteria bacterium]|nr:hypothetical protein [Deltaproteobacteria bacterium]